MAGYVPKPEDKVREFDGGWNKQDKFYMPCMDEITNSRKRLD